MTKEGADNLLARWGEWSRHSIKLGDSSKNLIYRMMNEGTGASHQTIDSLLSMPDDIERVEALINLFSPSIKKVLKLKYIAELPNISCARKCRCTEDEFISRLNYVINIVAMEF